MCFPQNPSISFCICKKLLTFLNAEGDAPHYLSLSSTHLLQLFLIATASFFPRPQFPVPYSIPLLMVAQAGDGIFWGSMWTAQRLLSSLAGHVAWGITEPFYLTPIFSVCCDSSLRFLPSLPTRLKPGEQLNCFRQPQCNHANAHPWKTRARNILFQLKNKNIIGCSHPSGVFQGDLWEQNWKRCRYLCPVQ